MQLMEIEKRLAGPDKMQALEEYDGTLRALSQRIDSTMQEGVAPDDFRKLEDLREATILARKLLRLTVQSPAGNTPERLNPPQGN